MKTKDEIISVAEAAVAAYSNNPVWYKISIEKYMDEWLKANKMWGCYACGKLLRIYATKREADDARPRWSAECIVEVKEVAIGDGGV